MILATNIITRKTCEYLLKAGQLTRKSGYESLADHLLGPIGKLITELGIIGLLLGTLISFQVVIGDLSPGLFNSFFGFPETWSLRMLLMCISSLGVIPLALMRNLSSLANMNALSMSFYCIFILVVFVMSLKNIIAGDWVSQVNFWKPSGIFHCLPILSLAFSCQTQVFVMYEAIPEPSIKAMSNIIDKAINLVTVMYLSVGFFGYVAFYEAGVRGDILSNFPNGILSDTIKAGFWVSIMMSFPLIIFPVRIAIHSLLFSKDKRVHSDVISSADDYIPQNRFTIITFLLIAGTLTVGILIPHIETVLSVTGAVIGTFLCFVFPAGLYLLATDESTNGKGRTLAKIIFVIGLMCMVASTLAVLSGGSSEAQHQEHPGHAAIIPPTPNLPKDFINKQGEKLEHNDEAKERKVDNLIDKGAGNGEENQAKVAENIKIVATTRTARVLTEKLAEVKEKKAEARKLQQVNNESKNEAQENAKTKPESAAPSSNSDQAKSAPNDVSKNKVKEESEKSILRVKKDEESDKVDAAKQKVKQEKITKKHAELQGNLIEDQEIKKNNLTTNVNLPAVKFSNDSRSDMKAEQKLEREQTKNDIKNPRREI
eukprot:gene8970-9928_t